MTTCAPQRYLGVPFPFRPLGHSDVSPLIHLCLHFPGFPVSFPSIRLPGSPTMLLPPGPLLWSPHFQGAPCRDAKTVALLPVLGASPTPSSPLSVACAVGTKQAETSHCPPGRQQPGAFLPVEGTRTSAASGQTPAWSALARDKRQAPDSTEPHQLPGACAVWIRQSSAVTVPCSLRISPM